MEHFIYFKPLLYNYWSSEPLNLELDDPLQITFLKKSIKYKCKHGGKSRTKITNGSRPNQHTYCTECPFEANLILV